MAESQSIRPILFSGLEIRSAADLRFPTSGPRDQMRRVAMKWAREARLFAALYERLSREPEWIVKSLPTGHDILVKAQEEFLASVQELKCVAAT